MPHASRLSRYSCCTSSGAGFRTTWNWWCLNRRFGLSPKRPSAGRRDGCTYATFQCAGPSTRRNVSGCIVPAPTSTSSGCCSAHPRDAQNSCSFRMRPWNVIGIDTKTAGGHKGDQPQRHKDTEEAFLFVSSCLCGFSYSVCSATFEPSPSHLPQHARRLQVLLQVHCDQRAVRHLELPQRLRRHGHV